MCVRSRKYNTTHCVMLDVMLLLAKRNERCIVMDTASLVRSLREKVGMNRKEFSEYTRIPVRTLEDWEAARRQPPEYVPRLLMYQLRFTQLTKADNKSNINIIANLDGKKIVLINDVRFKSRRNINWIEIKEYLKEYIGEYYEILETSEKVYRCQDRSDPWRIRLHQYSVRRTVPIR